MRHIPMTNPQGPNEVAALEQMVSVAVYRLFIARRWYELDPDEDDFADEIEFDMWSDDIYFKPHRERPDIEGPQRCLIPAGEFAWMRATDRIDGTEVPGSDLWCRIVRRATREQDQLEKAAASIGADVIGFVWGRTRYEESWAQLRCPICKATGFITTASRKHWSCCAAYQDHALFLAKSSEGDADSATDVYLLTHDGQMKVGIAKHSSSRIKEHVRRGWTLDHTVRVPTRRDALRIEKAVLDDISVNGGRRADPTKVPSTDGITECREGDALMVFMARCRMDSMAEAAA